MSKFFYRGTPDIMSNYGKEGYNTNASVRPGTENAPLSLIVNNEQRRNEVQKVVDQHELFATIKVVSDAEESIKELETVLNRPKPQRFEKTPERNSPCSCGSNKKYKKCCGS